MKWTRLIVIGVPVALLALYLWPLIDPGIGQDSCQFGPVTNAQYRQALAKVGELQAGEWGPLPLSGSEGIRANEALSAELTRRVKIIEATLPDNIYGRIAAVHAVVRGAGGDYLATMAENIDSPSPFESARQLTLIAYRLDMNRLGYFRPFRRWIAITAGFPVRDQNGAVGVRAVIPYWLDPSYLRYARSVYHPRCPAVPSRVDAETKLPN